MKTKILKIQGDTTDIMNLCRSTVNKPARETAPSEKFVKNILISEHSPIRAMSVMWEWENIPSYVATHFSRHKWECFITTQRTDRTGINRDELPQNTPVNFVGYANLQNLIDTARKRLCHCSSDETRKLMEDLKTSLPEEISFVLVPNCIYRGGCPEISNCGYYEFFVKRIGDTTTIVSRYEAYNKYFKLF